MAATGHHNTTQANQKVGFRKKHGNLLVSFNVALVVTSGLPGLVPGFFLPD